MKYHNIVFMLACSFSPAFAVEPIETVKEKSLEAQMTALDANKDSHHSQSALADARSVWPVSPPVDAIHKVFTRYNETFDFYLWRANGYTWVATNPYGAKAWVCTVAFSIVQGGKLFSDIKIEKISGSTLCEDITGPGIYLLNQYSFSVPADLDVAFTLYHDKDVIVVPAKTAVVVPPVSTLKPAEYGTVTSGLSIHLPSLLYNSPTGIKNVWADLEFYGASPNGETLLKIKSYGVNP